MGRAGSVLGVGLLVGVIVSMTGAGAKAGQVFHVACTIGDSVDKTRAAAICEEFLATAQDLPDLSVISDLPAPLTVGPGLEVRVDGVGDGHLDLTPTWVDAQGQRTPQTSVGLRITDRAMNEDRRRDFYIRLLAKTPK